MTVCLRMAAAGITAIHTIYHVRTDEMVEVLPGDTGPDTSVGRGGELVEKGATGRLRVAHIEAQRTHAERADLGEEVNTLVLHSRDHGQHRLRVLMHGCVALRVDDQLPVAVRRDVCLQDDTRMREDRAKFCYCRCLGGLGASS